MKRKKSGRPVLVAYLCVFRPEPEGGFTVTCPKLPPVVSHGETLEEAQANAREAIELCLEVMREDGEPIPPPDRDLASPIEQLVPVAAAMTTRPGRAGSVLMSARAGGLRSNSD